MAVFNSIFFFLGNVLVFIQRESKEDDFYTISIEIFET